MYLSIEYVPITEITPYERNAKLHPGEQIEQIKKSIKEFGFNDPIAVWHGEIVEGHGRLMAARELGFETLPIIRLDNLTDEQRRAYALAHNKLTMNSGFDIDMLNMELDALDFDMSEFGFEELDEEVDEDGDSENIYTSKVDVPQYEPSGEDVSLSECLDREKYDKLIKEIEESGLSDDEKAFLMMAAARHLCFSYKKIADYYASNASEEMQKLMEESALVIIDYNDAIKNGYAVLRKTVTDLMTEDGYGT